MGLGLVAVGDIGVCLSNRDDLACVGVSVCEAEVHIDEGEFTG